MKRTINKILQKIKYVVLFLAPVTLYSYQLRSYVISAGGIRELSSSYILEGGSLSQLTSSTPWLSSSGYKATIGFWHMR